MKLAFSTVACPQFTLPRAAALAGELGYTGLELRSFGPASSQLACEPFLTGGARARDIFEDAGVAPACLASSIRFDAPIFPPVIGRVLGDVERPVRETREMVHLAATYECPYVRVFGFELQPGERRTPGLRRLLERLDLAVRTARHTGVKLVLENGGSFPESRDLLDILDRIGSPLLEAAYSPAAALAAGEDPAAGIRNLGPRLAMLKLKDYAAGRPVPAGEGEARLESAVRAAKDAGFRGWAVVEHDQIWFPSETGARAALARSAQHVYGWIGAPASDIERRKFAVPA